MEILLWLVIGTLFLSASGFVIFLLMRRAESFLTQHADRNENVWKQMVAQSGNLNTQMIQRLDAAHTTASAKVESLLREIANQQTPALDALKDASKSLTGGYERMMSSQQEHTTALMNTAGAMHAGQCEILRELSKTFARDYGKQALDIIRELAPTVVPPGRAPVRGKVAPVIIGDDETLDDDDLSDIPKTPDPKVPFDYIESRNTVPPNELGQPSIY